MFDFIKSLFKPKADFRKLMQDGAVIVDVRTTGEYQAGHINGSLNIPLNSITQQIARLKNLEKPVIVVCRSGSRSGMAKSILSPAGIEVFNGGGWTSLKRQLID